MARAGNSPLCDHAAHECFGANGEHRVLCACGCGRVVVLRDSYRLATAPGWGGGWYAMNHGELQGGPWPAAARDDLATVLHPSAFSSLDARRSRTH